MFDINKYVADKINALSEQKNAWNELKGTNLTITDSDLDDIELDACAELRNAEMIRAEGESIPEMKKRVEANKINRKTIIREAIEEALRD